ncbi:MAG TPA: RsmD family RNA methyltransferase, partial [Gemmatimonadaceae bacterium]
MRIVGGKLAGRELESPNDFRVRPTAELVRAAMLGRLVAVLKDARVLDLFAGTGALGLEALSRGAASADFVETRGSSLHALKSNIASLRMRERTRVFKKDALHFVA